MLKRKSLSSKLVRLVALLLIVQIVILSVVNSFQSYNSHKELVLSRLEKEVQNQKKTITVFYNEITQDLSLLSQQFKSLSFEEENRDLVEKLGNDLLNYPRYKSIFEYDKRAGEWKPLLDKNFSVAKQGMLDLSSIRGINRLNYGEVYQGSQGLRQLIYIKNEYNKGIAIELDLSSLLTELNQNVSDLGNTAEVILFQYKDQKQVSFYNSAQPSVFNLSLTDFFKNFEKNGELNSSRIKILKTAENKDVITGWEELYGLDWLVLIEVNQLEAFMPVFEQIFTTILLSVIGLLILILITYFYTRRITKPLAKLASVLKEMEKGDNFNFKLNYSANDEVGQMVQSVTSLYNSQLNLIDFAKHIADGDFTQDKSIQGELGQALISMSDNLRKSKEEDQRRDWVNSGMANFGTILRNTDQSDTQLFYNTIISTVVKYVGLNQGTLYLLGKEEGDNENEWYLDQVATYAYDRIKSNTKRYKKGEGIISEAVLQEELIHLTEIPQNYVSITSGLGETTPDVIVIVPLKYKDDIVGVIEVAGFNDIEDYKKEYLSQVAESIASVIIASQVKERTNQLLKEANIQTKQLKEQEEQMQQTLEEMQVNQEKLLANEEENQILLDKLKNKEKEMEKKWMVHESELNSVMEGIMNDLTEAQAIDKQNKVIANYYQLAFERLDTLILIFEEEQPSTPKFATVNSETIIGYDAKVLTEEGFDYRTKLAGDEEALAKRNSFVEATMEGELVTEYMVKTDDGKEIPVTETLYMIPGKRRKKAIVIAKINRLG